MNVHVFIPCFVDQLYPEAGFNTIKVLERAGCNVTYNPAQTCCGQPAFNAGYWGEAREVCNKFIADFAEAEYIVIPSASCSGFVKNYYSKIYDNASNQKDIKHLQGKVFELTDFLVNILKTEDLGASLNGKATYHDSCAALRECKIKSEPRKLLQHVKGLELIELQDNETCCGFGGTFAVKFESISVAMGEQKAHNVMNTKADYLISSDLSCLMHISGVMANKGISLKSMHIADVLASGY
ncbi:MAG: (Fe-S)-binding protein [bacterium]|jgi:L-lactate dehydrogenase complex protein LldE